MKQELPSISGTLSELVAEELYERAAAAYVDILEKQSRPPKVTQVMARLCEEHPDIYPKDLEQHYLAKLHNPDFNSYLEKYRGEYIQRQLAPKLLAAHMGHKIGSLAVEKLIERLDDPEADIKTKDLVALAQLGFGLAEKVGKEMVQQQGDTPQVHAAFQQVLLKLDDSMAEAMMLEIIRRQRKVADIDA